MPSLLTGVASSARCQPYWTDTQSVSSGRMTPLNSKENQNGLREIHRRQQRPAADRPSDRHHGLGEIHALRGTEAQRANAGEGRQDPEIPTVLTSSMEEHAQGPLLSELETILPDAFAARIKRLGIVNAMDDENFAAAVKATGRNKLIIAGVTNDVCTVYPALGLVRDGFEVQVVADAGASPTKAADDIALRRMDKGGVTLTSTNQVIAELVGSWGTPEGGQLVQVLMEALTA